MALRPIRPWPDGQEELRLEKIQRLRERDGFLPAMDLSVPKALQSYSITEEEVTSDEEAMAVITKMRARVLTAPAFNGERIIASTFREAALYGQVHGKYFPQYLWEEKGVMTFAAFSAGLQPLVDDVCLMVEVPDMESYFPKFIELGVIGVQLGTLIKGANRDGIRACLDQHFRMAETILAWGLVPLIVPEVYFNIPDKAEAEEVLQEELVAWLDRLGPEVDVVIRVALPTQPDAYKAVVEHKRCLKVAALPGDLGLADACRELARNHGLVCGFNRSLLEGVAWRLTDEEIHQVLEHNFELQYQASCTLGMEEALQRLAARLLGLLSDAAAAAPEGGEEQRDALRVFLWELLEKQGFPLDTALLNPVILEPELSPLEEAIGELAWGEDPEEQEATLNAALVSDAFLSDRRIKHFLERAHHAMVSGDAFDDTASNASVCDEIRTDSFGDLSLPRNIRSEVELSWATYVRSLRTKDKAGEAIYAAVVDAMRAKSLFKAPKSITALRMAMAMSNLATALSEPKRVRLLVEALAFQHMELDVTVNRVNLFRDAVLEQLENELGDSLNRDARLGWRALLGYTGGAFIYVRTSYSERLKLLSSSWATANSGAAGAATAAQLAQENEDSEQKSVASRVKVPANFKEMFAFNSKVMGFGNAVWMQELLSSFDVLVENVTRSIRFQEECDVLSLRLAPWTRELNFPQFKAVMFASLRALVPKDWDSNHETAWTWLWDNVQRSLEAQMGKPAAQSGALHRFWSTLSEDQLTRLHTDIFTEFFVVAPVGQDHFKQSSTRLRYIASRGTAMSMEIYKDPKKLVEDISGLGLRHVGFGAPPELFGPFVGACLSVFRSLKPDPLAAEAFQWSISLIARILSRTTMEGSTLVMQAINANSSKQIRKALCSSPRGQRSAWMLNIVVGTQSISPLSVAVRTRNTEAARAILEDLTTIRADRDRYYYGVEDLFMRHPDTIRMLLHGAPELIPTLLDGMVWRSALVVNGRRRVNYYIENLMVTNGKGQLPKGVYARALGWLADAKEVSLITHPAVILISDQLWRNLAAMALLAQHSLLILSLALFIMNQSVLNHLHAGRDTFDKRVSIFICRLFIYVVNLGRLLYRHTTKVVRAYRSKGDAPTKDGGVKRIRGVQVPKYLLFWQEYFSLILAVTLCAMLATEPILYCLKSGLEGGAIFTELCEEADGVRFTYSVLSMLAAFCYSILLTELDAFSTHLAAFSLLLERMLGELCLLLGALTFLTLAFSCGMSCMEHSQPIFAGIPRSFLSLAKIALHMSDWEALQDMEHEPHLLAFIIFYVIAAVVTLLNIFTAQLTCSVGAIYKDMVGLAHVKRAQAILEVMPSIRKARWERFRDSLRFEERLEFNEGDLGLAGGIQVTEPANLHPTTVDRILRFGGSTSPEAPWLGEERFYGAQSDAEERLIRMERLLDKAVHRVVAALPSAAAAGGGSSMLASSAMQSDLSEG